MSGGPGVLLAILPQHTSVRDRPYLSGWLGKARVVAFAGEPDAGATRPGRSTSPSPSRGMAHCGRRQGRQSAIRGRDDKNGPSARRRVS
jgi:hypothetical protein